MIPYAQNLARLFTRDRLEVRKAFGQVTSLIQANALLHQYQRPRDDQARLIAQPQDYWLARQLLSDVLARSLGEQPADGLRRFVEQLQSLQLSGEYTTAEVAKLCRRNERTVREHLQELLKLSRIEQTQAARGPLPARWLIRANISLDDDAADLLPTVVDVCE